MSIPSSSRVRAIKDLVFTDDHVWIHGRVLERSGDRVLIDDGTGHLEINIGASADDDSRCTVKGSIEPGSVVRVIGEVISNTRKEFQVKPSIVQDIGRMGATVEVLDKIRTAEEKIRGEP